MGDKQLGVIEDRFFEQQEIVVKPLESMMENSSVSGSAILGDGRIALVVDVAELIKIAGKVHG